MGAKNEPCSTFATACVNIKAGKQSFVKWDTKYETLHEKYRITFKPDEIRNKTALGHIRD